MNNDLKNFLEEERKGYMRNSNWEVSESELQDHDSRLINFVLELVEKEVEISMAEHNETRHGNTPDDAYARVSTIINDLRVKDTPTYNTGIVEIDFGGLKFD